MAHRNFARAMRRKTQWGGFGNDVGNPVLPALQTVADGATVILSRDIIVAGAAGFVDEEITITRTIGRLTAVVNVDTALNQGSYAIGCGVFSSVASAAGVASLADPESSPDFEWLYYESGILLNPNSALRDGPITGITSKFDVRGQRIVRVGQTVVWLGEAQGNAMRMGVTGRYLMKLS